MDDQEIAVIDPPDANGVWKFDIGPGEVLTISWVSIPPKKTNQA